MNGKEAVIAGATLDYYKLYAKFHNIAYSF
jgi:hypothetical protein